MFLFISFIEVGLKIIIHLQHHQVTAYTYEHKYTDMQVNAAVLLVCTKLKVLKTNQSRLTERIVEKWDKPGKIFKWMLCCVF